MAQLMPLPLTVSCFSKIQIGFTLLVPAHLGSPGIRAIKWVCVCVCACVCVVSTKAAVACAEEQTVETDPDLFDLLTVKMVSCMTQMH